MRHTVPVAPMRPVCVALCAVALLAALAGPARAGIAGEIGITTNNELLDAIVARDL
ncbi:MAG: hypothetical protein HXY25_09830, partial [Alphaproteobacteria bacterium]|nr:hypothetical protein [Alphaproteobacteria bacterium]